MCDLNKIPDQRLLIGTSSLIKRRESLNSKIFNEKNKENYFHIEDYSESLIKDYAFNYPLEKSPKQIKDNWESIYHLKVKPNFKYMDLNQTQAKIPNHEPRRRQKTWFPTVVTMNKKHRKKSTESLILPDINFKLSDKPFEPVKLLQAKFQQTNDTRRKSLQKQLDILNSFDLEESNSKLARNLYFHPKTLSFTPFFKANAQKTKSFLELKKN
ncbi:hypothetical protein BpHYR1_034427 [Brachionus plicatilis]|uniref:Uncharacterized protein n=1 Tax=Brachionus plicatilis TaxID=10195 RepID=A0A3M7TAV7_BRAPC|nr:hypothetical protein BpHYR1_034427 [Brachionus plicatilis]